jgi:hypothetical protein
MSLLFSENQTDRQPDRGRRLVLIGSTNAIHRSLIESPSHSEGDLTHFGSFGGTWADTALNPSNWTTR